VVLVWARAVGNAALAKRRMAVFISGYKDLEIAFGG
jgi:hypothetical protein